jgi:hypothetical protein
LVHCILENYHYLSFHFLVYHRRLSRYIHTHSLPRLLILISSLLPSLISLSPPPYIKYRARLAPLTRSNRFSFHFKPSLVSSALSLPPSLFLVLHRIPYKLYIHIDPHSFYPFFICSWVLYWHRSSYCII